MLSLTKNYFDLPEIKISLNCQIQVNINPMLKLNSEVFEVFTVFRCHIFD